MKHQRFGGPNWTPTRPPCLYLRPPKVIVPALLAILSFGAGPSAGADKAGAFEAEGALATRSPAVFKVGAVGAPPLSAPPAMTTDPTASAFQTRPARVIVKLRSSLAQSLSSAMSPTTGAVNMVSASAANPALATLLSKHPAVKRVSPLSPRHVNEKRQARRSEPQIAAAMRQRFPARAARATARETPPDLSSTYILELGSGATSDVATTVHALRSDPNVLYAEEDKLVRVVYTPNDPSYSSTGSWEQPYDDLYGLKKIGAATAWDSTQGEGVVVAVVDTGVDYDHPDIKDNIWLNSGEIAHNGIDDDRNGFIDDVRGWDLVGPSYWQPTGDNDPFDNQGHGTHVAGTIAATGDNNEGVIGVAWKAKIMAVKGLDDSGAGYDSELAKAIIYAVDNGADVINASWGSEGFSQTLTDAVVYAHAHGVVFVAAAGNSSSDAANFAPANVPNAITVGALEAYDNLAYFSNFGSKIDLAAPGQDILSLEAGTDGYVRKDGTSMAAPHVSGVAALIIAQHPTFSNEQVRQVLRISATDFGETGKDTSFGYGRVDSAQAVLVDHALDAKILSPVDGIAIAGLSALTGTAAGPDFDYYTMEYGAGATPATWVTFHTSATSVTGGELGTFDPSTLSDGLYTIRLRAFDTAGTVFSDQIQIQVRYLEITWPAPPPVPSLTQQVKPGSAYQITGSAKGPSFQKFVLEWAPGAAATTGWSTDGFTLSGDGQSPVSAGVLGDWTPPSDLSGYYTLRLTVTNSDFSSETTSAFHAEPALVSSGWPAFVGGVDPFQSALPVRQPDGTIRLVVCGTYTSVALYSFAYDGSVETVSLNRGSNYMPAVGNLDGEPGDEIVVLDAYELKIFSSNLDLVRTITAKGRAFLLDRVSLADLDNDGVPEILAPARDDEPPDPDSLYETTGALCVFRVDGTFFSQVPPPTFSTTIFGDVKVAAVDLNGDGWKEIVIAYDNSDETSYTVEAFNADGSPYAGWTSLLFSNAQVKSLAVADLDHDGTTELILTEYDQKEQSDSIRVLNNTGAERPGWPVLAPEKGYGVAKIAIGDLDRDQRNEIVLVTLSKISVLRDDGSSWSEPWSNGGNPPWNSVTTPLIADIDGDGFPEILAVTAAAQFDDRSKVSHYSTLTSYRRDGTILQSWPLFGAAGQEPYIGTPLVGDFDGDGKTDVAVHISLLEGSGYMRMLTNTALTCLTTGTTFNAAGSDWVSMFHDPQNSRTTNAAPTITTPPQNQAAVSGTSATFTAAAGGNPIPTFQWQKDGNDIAGATSATLTLANLRPSAAGSYTVVATNIIGSAISTPATLTVSNAPPSISSVPSQVIRSGSTTGALAFTIADTDTGATELTLTGTSSNTLLVPHANIVFSGAGANRVVTVTPAINQIGSTVITLTVSDGELTAAATFTISVRPSYTGTYFGQLSNGGRCALLVREDQTALFLADLPTAQLAIIANGIEIGDDGAFSFGPQTHKANKTLLANRYYSGPIDGRLQADTLTGNLPDLAITFSGSRTHRNATYTPQSGYYETVPLGTSEGIVHMIVSDDGRILAVAVDPDVVRNALGTVTPEGTFTSTSDYVYSYTGSINIGSGSVTGTYQPAGGGVPVSLATPAAPNGRERLVNLSTRGIAGLNDNTLIAGLVVAGSTPKDLLIRAVGPTLKPLGVSGELQNPRLTLFQGGTAIAENDDWSQAANAAQIAETTGRITGLPFPAGSADAALLVRLNPGAYTAHVTSVDSRTGVAMVEAYDANDAAAGAPKLINISTRGGVGTGDNILIVGVVVDGNAPKRLLIRAMGPGLAALGVSGVLADPKLALYQGGSLIRSNDDWSAGSDAVAITAASKAVTGFTPAAGSKDSAMLLYLAPGSYTAQVSGVNDTTGVALVEVYEVP